MNFKQSSRRFELNIAKRIEIAIADNLASFKN